MPLKDHVYLKDIEDRNDALDEMRANLKKKKMKKIFVICPVRLATKETAKMLEDYTEKLETEGNKVYLPHRDTNQVDDTGGYKICKENATAIFEADEIYIFYDGRSQGIHFDIGVAFALGKEIKVITINNETPEAYLKMSDKRKEFPKMLKYWEDK